MAITSLDLKIKQSERLTDFPDGGGRMSAREVVDGQVNNVFPDLSDLNTIMGNVSLRKVFFAVETANTDTFLGPMAFLTDPPLNPTVSILMFDTGSHTDERAAARSFYENYRTRGPKSQYTLYGAHLPGSRMLMVYTRKETPTPDVGDVFCLSIERAGYTPAEQFVKVEKVESRVATTFTDQQGDFERDVLIISLTAPLKTEFPGQEDPNRNTAQNTPPTLVRLTQVTDAAKYYALKPCTVPPQAGQTVVHVGDPFVPAVPTSETQTPVVDQLAGLGTPIYIACSAPGALTWSGTVAAGAGSTVTRYFGTPYGPGTLAVTVGSTALRDDGHGGIEPVDPSSDGWSGVADYATGSFSLSRDTGFSGAVTATATAAGLIVQQAYTHAHQVTPANRAIAYVFQLPGQINPGSAVLDYRALGKWVRLTDNGRGRLVGNPGEGSVSINYATGTLAVTLGALPDIGSALVFAWGTDLRARNSSGEITVPLPAVRQSLDHPGVMPGTLVMSWPSGGLPMTASADASGAITGDAIGAFDAAAGIAEFRFTAAPDEGSQVTYSYDYVPADKLHAEVHTPSVAGGVVALTLDHPAAANSVVASWSLDGTAPGARVRVRRHYTVRDNGSGGFLGALGGTNTINYNTGALALVVEP